MYEGPSSSRTNNRQGEGRQFGMAAAMALRMEGASRFEQGDGLGTTEAYSWLVCG